MSNTTSTIEQFYAALAERNRPALLALLDPDIRVSYYGQQGQLPWAGEFHKIDGFDLFFTKIKENLDIVEVARLDAIADKQKVVVQCRGIWQVRANQELVKAGMVNIFTLENGRIIHYEIYVDTAAFASAMAVT